MGENEKWGETVDGIIEVLKNIEEARKIDNFDPYLNEYMCKLDNFVLKYIPKENINVKDVELQKNIEKIRVDYIKKGLYTAKVFMTNLFTEREMRNPQSFIKKLYRYRNELYEFTSFCDLQNPESETNKLFSQIDDNSILYLIEKIKRNCILIGFLLGKPDIIKKFKN